MSLRITMLIGVLAAACGPKSQDGPETSATSETSESGGDETTGDPTTGDPPLELTPDEQFCVDRCQHYMESEACGWFDASCYGGCLDSLEYLRMDPCGAERQASIECELMYPLGETCEAVECADVYLDEDVCEGFCFHLGGYPSSGGSPEECEWGASSCFGHELEMRCPVGDDPLCSCKVDGVEVSTCQLGMKLGKFSCGGDDLHVFSGCCTDVFVEALQ